MAEPNLQPESPQAQPTTVDTAAKPQVETTQQGPQTAEDKSFEKQVDEKLKAHRKEVEELHDKFKKLHSTGAAKAEVIKANQLNRLSTEADKRKSEFLSIEATAKSSRMSMMLSETEQELNKMNLRYKQLLQLAGKLANIDEMDLVKLEALLDSMSTLKKDPQLEALFLKALNQEKFEEKDFALLSSKIFPVDIENEIVIGKGNKIFEASQIGAVISVMNPADRLELCKVYLRSHTAEDGYKLLDLLNATGMLTPLQLTYLCAQSQLQDPYKTQLLAQLDSGKPTAAQEKYQRTLATLAMVNGGRTADPALSKTVGTPLLFTLSSMFGALTMFINFKAKFKMDHPLKSAAEAVTDPSFALGAMALGVGVGGLASIVDPQRFGDVKEKTVKFMAGPEKQGELEAARQAQIRELLESPFKSNPYLAQFMTKEEEGKDGRKRTGFQILQEIISDQTLNKQTVKLTLADIKAKSSPHQVEVLNKALPLEKGKEDNLEKTLQGIMAGCFELKIDTNERFAQAMAEMHKKQGTSNPTATA